MRMSNADDTTDFEDLVALARQIGFDSTERVTNRLQRIIARNKAYLEYRQKRSRHGVYNETVAEDSAAIAMAIELLRTR